MEWKFTNEEGQEEVVAREAWVWEAKYSDGTVLEQFDQNGMFHQFKELEQQRVSEWSLRHVETNQVVTFMVPPESEAALIHKYHRYILDRGGPNERRATVYKFGYKLKGQTAHYNYMLPDGRIIQTTEHIETSNFGL